MLDYSGDNYRVTEDEFVAFDSTARRLSYGDWRIRYLPPEMVRKEIVPLGDGAISASVLNEVERAASYRFLERVAMIKVNQIIATLLYTEKLLRLEHFRTVSERSAYFDLAGVSVGAFEGTVRVFQCTEYAFELADERGLPVPYEV